MIESGMVSAEDSKEIILSLEAQIETLLSQIKAFQDDQSGAAKRVLALMDERRKLREEIEIIRNNKPGPDTSLQDELEEHKELLTKANDSLRGLEEKRSALEQELSTVRIESQGEIQSLRERQTHLDGTIVSLTQEIQQAKDESQSVHDTLSKLTGEYESLKKRLLDSESKERSLLEQIHQYEEKLHALDVALKESSDSCIRALEDLKQSQEDRESKVIALGDRDKSIESLEKKLTDLTEELNETAERLKQEEQSREGLSEVLAIAQAEKIALENRLEGVAASLEESNGSLKKALVDAESLKAETESKISELTSEGELLQKTIADRESQLQLLKEELEQERRERTNESSLYQLEREGQKRKESSLETEIKKRALENSCLEALLQRKEREYEENVQAMQGEHLQNQNRLEAGIRDLESSLSQLKDEKTSLESERTLLEEQIETITGEHAVAIQKLTEEREQDRRDFDTAKQSLISEFQEKEKSLEETARVSQKRFEEELTSREHRIQDLSSKIIELETEQKELQESLKTQRAETERWTETAKIRDDELLTLRGTLEQARKDLKSLGSSLDTEKEERARDCARLQGQIDSDRVKAAEALTETLEIHRRLTIEFEQEKTELHEQLNQTKKQASLDREERDAALTVLKSAHEKEMEGIRIESESLRKRALEAEERALHAERNFEEQKTSLNIVNREHREVRAAAVNLQDRLDKLEASSRAEREELERKVTELQEKLLSVKEARTKAEKDLVNATSLTRTLSLELSTTRKELELMKMQYASVDEHARKAQLERAQKAKALEIISAELEATKDKSHEQSLRIDELAQERDAAVADWEKAHRALIIQRQDADAMLQEVKEEFARFVSQAEERAARAEAAAGSAQLEQRRAQDTERKLAKENSTLRELIGVAREKHKVLSEVSADKAKLIVKVSRLSVELAQLKERNKQLERSLVLQRNDYEDRIAAISISSDRPSGDSLFVPAIASDTAMGTEEEDISRQELLGEHSDDETATRQFGNRILHAKYSLKEPTIIRFTVVFTDPPNGRFLEFALDSRMHGADAAQLQGGVGRAEHFLDHYFGKKPYLLEHISPTQTRLPEDLRRHFAEQGIVVVHERGKESAPQEIQLAANGPVFDEREEAGGKIVNIRRKK